MIQISGNFVFRHFKVASKSLKRPSLLLSKGLLDFKTQSWRESLWVYCWGNSIVSRKKLLLQFHGGKRLDSWLAPSSFPLLPLRSGCPPSLCVSSSPVSTWKNTPASSRDRCGGPPASVSPVGARQSWDSDSSATIQASSCLSADQALPQVGCSRSKLGGSSRKSMWLSGSATFANETLTVRKLMSWFPFAWLLSLILNRFQTQKREQLDLLKSSQSSDNCETG